MQIALEIVLFLAFQAATGTPEKARTLEPRASPHETYIKTVPVGGTTFVGLRVDPSDGPFGDRLMAFLPKKHAETSLCLTLISQDGRYSGKFEYDIGGVSGPAQLLLRTKYLRELQQYTNRQIAVLPQIANACDRAVNTIVAVGSQGAMSPQTITLFINSKGIDTEVRYGPVGHRRSLSCQGLPDGDRTAYDTECDLSPGADLGTLDILILRQHAEERLPSITVRVTR